jgi:hypothetical protein
LFLKLNDNIFVQDMVTQLQSGPSVVLEITHSSAGGEINRNQGDARNPVPAFREFVGPIDPVS